MTEGVVKFAVDKLESMATQELKLQTEVGKKVLDLRHELEWLRTFLRDADRKRRGSSSTSSGAAAAAAYDELIEVWVRQTRELAHDAEDLLEEFVHRGELHCHGCFDLPSFLRWLRHSAAGVFARHAIFDGIEDINKRIEQMKQQRKECNLEKLPCASKPHRKKYTDWSSLTELEIEDNLVKIGDYDEIKRLVLDQSRQRTVINLTGKSGIGKTTLASYLYRRSSIRKHFACTAWVHVPRKFRFADLLHDVIRQANASSGHDDDELAAAAADDDVRRRGGMEAERLVKARLAAALQGRRYLVVLDDVRSREEWAFFLAALPAGLAGSCVLVTTQVKISEESAAEQSGGVVRTRELGKLRPEQAAELFRRRVYGHGEPDPKKMEQLKKVVDSMTKGSNLPLNIVMLAGLLRSKKEDEWDAVIHSLDDTPPPPTSPEQMPPEKDSLDDIAPAAASETAPTSTEQTTKKKMKGKQMATSMDKILTVCMDDLPTHLKPCFLYFAGFTAQTPICAGKLVRLWVAEGFMQAKNGQTVEEHGEECLKELISRCLVQLVETDAAGGRVAAVSVHQAVLDFAQAEARDTNFLHVHSGAAGLSNGAARRLALRNTYDTDLAVMLEAPKLHTLLCDIPERAADAAGAAAWQRALELINGRAPTFSVHGSRFLRVMDLKGVRLPHRESLPEEIGWLIHLRYLGLSHTAMRHLPSSVKRLRNLQTLDVSRTYVEALPWRLWRNPSLRHVMARRLAAWSAPDERAVLPDLQTLHGVPWGRWARSGGGGGAIGKMTSLRSLMAWNVSAAAGGGGGGERLSSALAGLECLRSLDLEAAHDAVTTLPLWDLLTMLGLRQLEYLTLRGRVAPWNPPPPETTTTTPLQGHHHHHHHYLLPNLAKLELHRSECDQPLIDAIAKLPNLAELVLDEASYVKPYMRFPAAGFPKLRKLQLTSLDKLTECTAAAAGDVVGDGGGALPQLRHVSVFHCGKLNTFPVKMAPKLELLTIHDSEELKNFMDNQDNEHIHVVHGKMSKRRVMTAPK
uniref:NB-ARC domain-containing protein n=1 Tax=Oryza meridionalis TaxID=40149 RepID=A0A0E0EIS1_9ORYZ